MTASTPPRTATVLWKDASFFPDAEYGPEEKFRPYLTLSAGVLVEDTPEQVSLALCYNSELNQRSHVLVIPTPYIIEIVRHHPLKHKTEVSEAT